MAIWAKQVTANSKELYIIINDQGSLIDCETCPCGGWYVHLIYSYLKEYHIKGDCLMPLGSAVQASVVYNSSFDGNCNSKSDCNEIPYYNCSYAAGPYTSSALATSAAASYTQANASISSCFYVSTTKFYIVGDATDLVSKGDNAHYYVSCTEMVFSVIELGCPEKSSVTISTMCGYEIADVHGYWGPYTTTQTANSALKEIKSNQKYSCAPTYSTWKVYESIGWWSEGCKGESRKLKMYISQDTLSDDCNFEGADGFERQIKLAEFCNSTEANDYLCSQDESGYVYPWKQDNNCQ